MNSKQHTDTTHQLEVSIVRLTVQHLDDDLNKNQRELMNIYSNDKFLPSYLYIYLIMEMA